MRRNAIELDLYIPPDVTVGEDGVIATDDLDNVYRFNNQVDHFLMSFTGMGMPTLDYITQRGPYQHGHTVLDYRLRERVIQYVLRVGNGCSRTDYWDARSALIDAVRPNRQECGIFQLGRLRKILPNGNIRDIGAVLRFGPIFTTRSPDKWDEWGFTEVVRFECPDPTWFDPALQEAIWELTNLENLIFYDATWTDRLVFEGDGLGSGGIWFGETSLYQTLDITYTGTWLSYPTIRFIGPISQPQIWNLTTDEKIELAYDVPAGDEVTVALTFGNKTVSDNYGQNLVGTVTTDSNLATWHLAPSPEASGGVNQLQVIGDNAEIGTTQVRIEYYTRYIGV